MRFSRAAIILLLILLTLPFVWPLLKIGYTDNLGSLEPATLIMARRVAEDGIFGWFHNWYLGFPFRFAGPPATWWVLGFLKWANIADVLTSYRLLLFVSLVSFPISFYFLARKIFSARGPVSRFPPASARSSKKSKGNQIDNVELRAVGSPSTAATPRALLEIGNFAVFVSSLVLILLPSIGYIFPKYWAIGQNFGFAPSWILGASPSRSLALALLPLVLLAFWNLVERINYRRLLLASVLTSVFFLVDGVTPYSLLVGLGVILIIEGKRDFWEKLAVVSLSLLSAFLIDAFYFTPANIKLIALSPSISGIGLVSFLKIIFQAALGLGPAVLALFWLKVLNKKRSDLAFIILWLFPFLAITLIFYFSNVDFLTEYIRFLPELEIGIALLVGYLAGLVSRNRLSVLSSRLSDQGQSVSQSVSNTPGVNLDAALHTPGVRKGLLFLIVLAVLFGFYSLPKRQSIFEPNSDITKTVEYQIADWLKKETVNCQLSTVNCQRVFLSGSTAFWLNEFAPDIWQVRGDIDQASTNRFWDRATYQIRNSADSAETLNWLKALRVNYVVVHAQNSKEYYHDFKFPEKFENIGQKVYDNHQGDKIYQIEAKLASTVSSKALNDLSQFSPRDQKILLSNYVEWLEGGGEAELGQEKNKLSINTKVDNDRVIALGVTFDSGWRAQDSFGNQLTISKDPFANMVIVPRKIGQQEITLIFREGLDLWTGIGISLLSLFWVIFLLPKQLPKILKWVKSGWEEE